MLTKTSQKNFTRQDAKAQRNERCHFDRREKSFVDPSHSFGMTGLTRHLACFVPLRESSLLRSSNAKLNREYQICLVRFKRSHFYQQSLAKPPSLEHQVHDFIFLLGSKFPSGKNDFCAGFFDSLAKLTAFVKGRVSG